MTDRVQGHVPSWDGQARTWRRYTKEVAWFVSSTPVKKRRYVASLLISRLTGSARLLAMSWSRAEFDTPEGTETVSQLSIGSKDIAKYCGHYATIPVISEEAWRKHVNLPCQGNLGYEEFAEALIRLWEEQAGVDPAERNFGLPEVIGWDWWDDDYYAYDDNGDSPDGDGPPQPQTAVADESEERPTTPAPAAAAHAGAATGSSPSHQGQPQPTPLHLSASANSVTSRSKHPQDVSDISLADSFIMGVLRGWRLLQAACLSPEETRDILSTTQNKLDSRQLAKHFKLFGTNNCSVNGINHMVIVVINRHYIIFNGMNGWMKRVSTTMKLIYGLIPMIHGGVTHNGMMSGMILNGKMNHPLLLPPLRRSKL